MIKLGFVHTGKTLLTAAWVALALFCNASLAEPKEEPDGLAVVIADPFVNVHTGAGRGYPIFHILEKGETVWLQKQRTDWFKVVMKNGKTGWVKRSTLNATLNGEGPLIAFDYSGDKSFPNRRWELGMMGGDFGGASALTNYVGYHLTPNLAAELKYTQAFGSYSNSKLLSLNAVHQIFPNWRLSPFFTLGSGVILIEPDSDLVQSQDREDTVMTVGGGFMFYVSRRFMLRAEYSDHKVLTNRENNEEVSEWKAGFSVYF